MNRDQTSARTKAAPNLPGSEHIKTSRSDSLWAVIGLAGVLAFYLGFTGFRRFYEETHETRSLLDLVYLTLQLFSMNSGALAGAKHWELETARFLAPTVAAFAAVKALLAVFRDRFQMSRLRKMEGHVVICGLGKKGRQLAGDFLEKRERVVIIESDEDNDEIENCRERGAIVLEGNATSEFLLRKARVERAGRLFAVCADDGVNLETALLARRIMVEEKPGAVERLLMRLGLGGRKGRSMTGESKTIPPVRSCFVHVVDTQLRDLLARHEFFSEIGGRVEIKCFNVFENGARRLFRNHPPDAVAAERDQKVVHLLIVGFGRMGQSVALQAARVGHYAGGERVRITVVDKVADRRGERFLHTYPKFGNICDISFIRLNTDDIQFLKGSYLTARGGRDSVTQAIICLEDEAAGLVCALHLAGSLKDSRCPVIVRVNVETQLVSLLQGEKSDHAQDGEKRRPIHAFGSITDTCSTEMVLNEEIDRMAKKVHAGYLRFKFKPGLDPAQDDSMKPWDDLPETLKESNRQQTEHMEVKLRAVGCRKQQIDKSGQPIVKFEPEEIELLAQMEHSRWNAERFLDGWVHGPKKDLEKKINPCLVEWTKLPEEIKDYDRKFVRDMPDVLAEIGEEIVRGR